MAIAETAKLVASLELKDQFSATANKAIAGLGKMESTAFRVGQQIGKGMKNAAANIARIGKVAAVVFAGAIAFGIRSLADLQRANAQTAAVIQSTGGKAKVSAAQVREYAEALENVTTVDDKVIQDGENLLLTFTGIGGKVFPRATTAMTNMAIAMAKGNVEQVDLKSSAIQLGKALNDPVKGITSLTRVGVSFTEQQKKQIKQMVKNGDVVGAQTVILKELEKEFGKAGEAAGKGPEAVWRRLQDVGEDLSQALARGLLPVLEKVGTWLSTKLADPAVIRTIDRMGTELGELADSAFEFIRKVDFKAIGAGLSVAAGAARGIVTAFMAMPDWVKTAVIGGWGLNKLTGGALGGIVGELGKGLIKGVLGMTAGVVNINAGVVNGGGGLPGGAGGAAAGGPGVLATIAAPFIAVAAVAAVAAWQQSQVSSQGSALQDQTKNFAKNATDAELARALKGTNEQLAGLATNEFGVKTELTNVVNTLIAEQNLRAKNKNGGNIQARTSDGKLAAIFARAVAAHDGKAPSQKAVLATLKRNVDRQEMAIKVAREAKAKAQATAAAVKDADSSIRTGAAQTATAARDAGTRTSTALKRLPAPITNVRVNVNVAPSQVQKTYVIQTRYGPVNGSMGSAELQRLTG